MATDRTAHSIAAMREKNPRDIALVQRRLSEVNSYKISKHKTSCSLNHDAAECPSLIPLCYLPDFWCGDDPWQPVKVKWKIRR